MPRPRIADRRRLIVEAARAAMLAGGWRATSVAQIAQAAGIGKGAVYLEFADKDAIRSAVLTDSMRRLTQGVRRRIQETAGVIDLATAYRVGVEALLEEPVMRALYLADDGVLGEHADGVGDDRFGERTQWLGDYLDRLQEAGVVDSAVDRDVIVRTLSVFTVGLIHAPRLLGPTTDSMLSRSVDLFADLVARGLAGSGPVDASAARAAHGALLERLDRQLASLQDAS